MANSRADEEAQMNQALQPQEHERRAPKPAWLDQNGQYSLAIVAVAAGIFLQLLPEDFIDGHDIRFSRPLALILFLLCLFAGILSVFKCEISGMETVKYPQKMVVMILNLLIEAALMTGNVIFLGMVDKSYLPISASISVLGFILVVILFYSKLEPDQEQELQGHNEDIENMVKNCFKVANPTTSIGFGVQTAVVIYCLKNHVSPKDHPQYSLIVAFLTSMLGSFSSTIATSPLKFQSDVMCHLLKPLPIIMLLLQGLVAVFVSAKFLDPTLEVFAVCIPCLVMFLVNLCPKTSKEQVAQEDSKSMFGALAVFGIGAISTIYTQKHVSGNTYLTSSVLFLLMAIITSLMRMAFIFRLTCTFIERVNNALPMVLTLVGVALLLIEFSKDVTAIGMEIAATPIAIPGQVFPPFPH